MAAIFAIFAVIFLTALWVIRRNERLIPYSYETEETALQQNLLSPWHYSGTAKAAHVQTQFGKDNENAKLRVSRDNSSLEFQLPLNRSRLTAQHDTLTYSNDQKKQEVTYKILPNGVKEEIILHEKPTTNIVTSQVLLKNLQGKADPQSPRFFDKNNIYQFHFAPPFVEDAKGDRTYQVTYTFLPIDTKTESVSTNFTDVKIATELVSNQTYVLALIIDSQWLESSDRAYPLKIDPTVLHESTPTISVATHDNMRLGTQTPSIRFASTDPGSQDLEYQVQWATDSSMAGATTVNSETGSGFSNVDTPSDTHPFTSGEAIQFTFPTLTNSTTYFYRIQSKVSGGSYDAWTTIRSLTIDTSRPDATWFQTHSDQFSTGTYGSDIRIDTSNNLVYTRDTNVYTPIQVTNSGGTLTNHDLLVNLNTATIISQGKMQADCDDLRFYNNPEFSTSYTYWIESGCNTANTQVWVRIPSLATGTTTIYAGYLNPGASAGSSAWSGSVIIPKTASCPGGSTRVTALDGLYLRGASSYGGTGGTATHRHTVSGTTGYTLPRGAEGVWAGCGHQHRGDHTHTFSFNSTYANTAPPSINTVFCSYSSFPQLQTTDAAFFSSTPTGWTHDANFDTRFMVGSDTYGVTGGGSHIHEFSGNINSASGGLESSSCSSQTIRGGTHNHAVYTAGSNNDLSTVTALPPYQDQIVAKPNSANASVPQGAILPFTTATLPPYGWTQYSALNDVFPRGNSTAGGTGGSTTHTHTFSLTINGTPSYTAQSTDIYTFVTGATLGVGRDTPTEGHSKNGTSGTGTSEPPYFNTVFGQKKTDSTSKTVLPEVNSVTDTITSTSITLAHISAYPNWNEVVFNEVETYGDLKVQVAYDSGGVIVPIPDGALPGNSTGFDTSPIDISGLSPTTYPTIYLRATITSDGASDQSAQLLDWEINTVAKPSPPTGLWVEGQANPTITTLTPTLSAIYEDFEVNDQATAYQIQVSLGTNFATNSWDTGKIALDPDLNRGSRSTDVTYGGETLIQGRTYYWRIKFWDSHDLEGNWSNNSENFLVLNLAGPTSCIALYNAQTNEIDITWVDQDTEEDNFVIEKLTEPGSFGPLITLGADVTSHTDTDVAPSSVYQYRINAIRDSIISAWCTTSRVSSSIGTFMVN